ncbi:hypothetical protein HPB52_024708 [Rhipicephalus sanguineus]|uniref:Uncharacterized protein n=1 Tax=Rhipicephalus sanguineus TaxID=34632 RepID=A0A9D4SMF2_RHISA|nr:hypothetical protein HPB52_024708 [Rhipicephalus sanguineus]
MPVRAASGSTSPPHEQEEASRSCWKELRRRDKVATDQNFYDFANADADADTDITEVIDDEETVQLVPSTQEESEDANDPDTVEAPVLTPSQMMDAVDLLRRFAEAVKASPRGCRGRFDFTGQLQELCAPTAQEALASGNHQLSH